MIDLNLNVKTLRSSSLYNLKINMCMKDNGKITKDMVEEFSNGRMALFMKDTGKIMLLTDLVD